MQLLSDPLTLALALLALVLLGLAKGGFSGLGALATPLLALTLPPITAAALLLPVLLVQDVISVWSYRDSWDRWIAGWMLPGAALGVGLATVLAAVIPETGFLLLLGVLTLTFGLYRLWIERGGRIAAASTSPGWVGSLFGVGMGLASQIAHAGGPPFQMWVAPRRLAPTIFAGTGSVIFAAVNWMKVPSYAALGSFTPEVLAAAALLIPPAVLTTLVGVWVVRRIEPARFYVIINALMCALGLRLIWQGLA